VLPLSDSASGCEDAARNDATLQQGIRHVLRRTCLDGRPVVELLAHTAAMLTQCTELWRTEIEALLDSLEIVKTREGTVHRNAPSASNWNVLRREYLRVS